MMGKHTPGPWRSRPVIDGRQYINAPSGLPIAIVAQHDERDANARLIAAAPELLAQVRGLLRALDAGADFQLGPKGHHATLPSELRALLARIDGTDA